MRNLIPETQLYKKYVLKEDVDERPVDDTAKPVQEANQDEAKDTSDAEANMEQRLKMMISNKDRKRRK